MSKISVTFTSTYSGCYEDHACEFQRVSFVTEKQLNRRWLETALQQIPACADPVEFGYNPECGTGSFILTDTTVSPGIHVLRYPLPQTITQRTLFRWQHLVKDETCTHIATGVHGFESLCCSELGADSVEKVMSSADSKVTCPRCRLIWQDCQAFTEDDFVPEE